MPRISPAMIVAMVALVAAVAGPAIADQAVDAARRVNLIDGKKIAKRSIQGNRLRKNTLGGPEVNESRLAQVPSAKKAETATTATKAATATSATSAATAATATTAATADTLDGVDSSQLSRRLWAVIEATGAGASVVRGSGVTGTGRLGNGVVYVSFDRDITACGYVASVGSTTDSDASGLFATVEQRDATASPTDVLVRSWDAIGVTVTLADPGSGFGFHLAVLC